MKVKLLKAALFIFAAAGMTWALARFGFDRESEWSTRSPEALAAFQEGLDSHLRFYETEAAASFRRAVELDPEFAAARVQLAIATRQPEERKQLVEGLGATDLSRLSVRERLLVEMALANRDLERQAGIAARALAERPDDPWVLMSAATVAWEREEFSEAERLYRALLEVDPNWVTAHNHLGYLAMSRARFDESEAHFRTYAFVAPDQANPHDSLGELLALRGRYDEARSELERALAEKPDFCASYITLVGIAIFEGRSDAFAPIVERARQNCPEPLVSELECDSRLIAAFLEQDPDRPWREAFIECAGKPGERGLLMHRLALLSGRVDEAAAEEAAIGAAKAGADMNDYGKGRSRRREVELLHEEGVRALLAGHAGEAAEKFRAADAGAIYWGVSEGRFKLFNLIHLATALERANDPEGSRRALEAVRKVNPAFADLYPKIVRDVPRGR